MKRRVNSGLYAGMVLTIAALVSVPASLQAGPPTLSTNPAKHVIFPAKDQSPEQQKLDETAAYDWATKQTGFDPYIEHDKLVQKGLVAADKADAAKGGGLKAAAGGAILGAVIGEISGDAGKGAAIGASAGGLTGGFRTRRTQKAAGGEVNAAVTAYKEKFLVWDRNFVAAMEGKGYTVK